jgi:hypothetical protein
MNSCCLFLRTSPFRVRFIARQHILIQTLFTQAAPNPGAKARTPVASKGSFPPSPILATPRYSTATNRSSMAFATTPVSTSRTTSTSPGTSTPGRFRCPRSMPRRGCRGADRQRLRLSEITAGKFTLSISVSGGFAAFGRQSSNPQRRYRALQGAKSRASAPSPLPYTEGEFRALTGREGRSQQITGGKAQ